MTTVSPLIDMGTPKKSPLAMLFDVNQEEVAVVAGRSANTTEISVAIKGRRVIIKLLKTGRIDIRGSEDLVPLRDYHSPRHRGNKSLWLKRNHLPGNSDFIRFHFE